MVARLVLAAAALAATAHADATLQLAGCPREAAEYAAVLEDRIVLDRAFLDDKVP